MTLGPVLKLIIKRLPGAGPGNDLYGKGHPGRRAELEVHMLAVIDRQRLAKFFNENVRRRLFREKELFPPLAGVYFLSYLAIANV